MKTPMTLKPHSSNVLALAGVILMLIGGYFVLLRPALLPEDLRFIGTSSARIQADLPGLQIWLGRVFWVMGGYIFTTGVFTTYVAITSFRMRIRGAAGIVFLTGLTSIGWMATVNFIISSDFKWVLLSFASLWLVAIALYRIERPES